MLMNIPRAILALVFFILYHKIVDVIVTLYSERDLFKSGHLQFVHSLREGLVIMDDHLKNIKLINVAARQMLQLPFVAENDNASSSDTAGYFEQL